MSVLDREGGQLCVCVFGVSILPLSTILTFDFGIVPTVWELFVFHFIIKTYILWKLDNFVWNIVLVFDLLGFLRNMFVLL